MYHAQRHGSEQTGGFLMARIHPTAIVDPNAVLDATVDVGAYSIIGPNVTIGARTKIGPHVVIEGRTKIGCDNTFFQFSSIGAIPQDKKYSGEATRLEIGDRNLIREYCTFNLGTALGAGVTRIGNDNWILAYVHIAHDCQVGNDTVFSNNAALAGHVQIGDFAILGGFAALHQFCKVGAHAFVGMNTSLTQDVPPFVIVSGNPAAARGVNVEGLKRRAFTREQIDDIRQAYKLVYRSNLNLDEAKRALSEQASEKSLSAPHIRTMREFLDDATRGIVR